jgi:GcrA cell cycle regulator
MRELTWTEERLALLKIHFEAGLSCREIACDIGVSRNAVIGKLSRLKLTRDTGDDPPRPPRRQAAKEKRLKTTPRLQYQILRAIYAEPLPVEADDDPADSEHCCSLMELSEAKCRWPISTPGAEDFRFCGTTPVDGLPYCPRHSRLAYRPGSRQRVARG